MLNIGLTGGIGSGKSTVANLFEQMGVEIIDTDAISHQITTVNTPCYQKIVTHFGNQVIQKNNELDRHLLRNIVFENPKERQWLEQLLHPVIRQQMEKQMQNAKSNYCITVVPLLIESQMTDLFDRILVVDVDDETQIQRALTRDKADKNQIQKIIQAQCSRKERLKHADDIIHNNGSIKNLITQVEKLHQRYEICTPGIAK